MKKFTMCKPKAIASVVILLALWLFPVVNAQVYNLPITGTDVVRCGAGELTLTVNWSNEALNPDQVKWYSVPFYGEPIATGMTFNTGYIEFTQTYYVDYIGEDGCSQCDRLLIRAVVEDQVITPQVIYPSLFYCNTANEIFVPTVVGAEDGIWEIAPAAGSSFNTGDGGFNPYGLSAGTYEVTFIPEEIEGCDTDPITVGLTVTDAPVQPEIYYALEPEPSVFCGSSGNIAVTQTGATGGTYSAIPAGLSLNPSTGQVNAATSLEGVYVVTYLIQASGGCDPVSANTTITINTISVGGTATADAGEISSGGSTTISLSGFNGSIQWQSATVDEEGSYENIINETGSTLNTGELTETTHFRALVTNGVCAAATSTVATITVSAASNAGIASVDPEVICTGSATTLTLTGYTGNIQWQSNETGSFVDIPGAVSNTYTTPVLTNDGTVDETIHYRAVVTEGLSAPDISGTVTVTIRPNPQPGLAIGDNICSGNNGTVNVFDYLGDAVQWQSSSSEDGPFENIEGATNNSHIAEGLTSTTYYRAEISNSPCNVVYSDVVAIEVSPPSVAGTASASVTSMCVGGTTDLGLTGYTGSIFWEYQAPGSGVWTYSGGNPTFTSAVLDVAGIHKFRAKVTSGVCDESMSNTLEIVVVEQPVWADYLAPEVSVIYGSHVSFSVAVENGLDGTITWVRSTSSGGEGEIVTSPDTPPAVGTYYYRPQYTTEGPFCALYDGTETEVVVIEKDLYVINAQVTTKTYDGNTDAEITGAELDGLVPGDAAGTDVVLENHTTGSFASEVVGTHSVTTAPMSISGGRAFNYSLIQPDLSGTITARELTVSGSFTAEDKTYDGTTDATIATNYLTLVGVQSVDGTPDDVVLNVTKLDFADANASDNITVSLTTAELTGPRADNYTLSLDGSPTTTASIIKKELTITDALAEDKVYDGTEEATVDFSDASLQGVLDGETATINSASYEAVFSQAEVGTDIPVDVTGVTLDGADAINYELLQPAGLTANITLAPLTITANDYDKGFGEILDEVNAGSTAFTVGDEQLKQNDMVGSVTITYLDDVYKAEKAVGEYPNTIQPSQAEGDGLANYDISYINGTMTIYEIIVTATEGLERKGYNTLAGAFAAIEDGTHGGEVEVRIYADTIETSGASLDMNAPGLTATSVNIIAVNESEISGGMTLESSTPAPLN